jgi:hypothetical protein
LRAQRNLARHGDPTLGEPLQIFPKLGYGGDLEYEFARHLIRQGEAGELAAIYAIYRKFYLTPGEGGGQLTPSFFLPANPNAFVADFIGNFSFSTYHALQAEVRKRLRGGLYLQANYTFSKALTDYEGSQSNFSGILDAASGRTLEKKRSSQDVTHIFKANWVYELPFGPGQRFLKVKGAWGKLLGGWSVSGILQARSGRPISILSGRGTVNHAGFSNKNTVNTTLSRDQLQKMTGLFKDAQGRPVLFDPRLTGADGRGSAEFFQNPTAGELGTLQLTPVSGPGYFNLDAGVSKRTLITEKTDVEFRAEFFNALNHANFFVFENQNINFTDFGRIASTFSPRILQFALKFNF